jgi:Tol biopolymer transport system component
MMIISGFLMLLAVPPAWSQPASSNCIMKANHKGSLTFLACRSPERLQLSLISSGGRVTLVKDADDEVLRSVIDTGTINWSPTDSALALEIDFDDEPGLLLVRVNGTPSAELLDTKLARLNVSATHPLWSSSGDWLLFSTSGTGERSNEGVYALRIKDGAIFRLLRCIAQSFTLAHDMLIVSSVVEKDPTTTMLAAFRFDELLRQKVLVHFSSPLKRK